MRQNTIDGIRWYQKLEGGAFFPIVIVVSLVEQSENNDFAVFRYFIKQIHNVHIKSCWNKLIFTISGFMRAFPVHL